MNDSLGRLAELTDRMRQSVVPDALPRVLEISRDIAEFSVKVSLVGQVKAGKTALTNSLINMPDLLPSDVNPWTTVITSVHINTVKPNDHRAVFTFFGQEEWDGMVDVGGRLGEAAQRANFDDEFAVVQDQIKAMQASAEQRLGKNFKYLLGSSHNFSGFDAELIKRYVCLGDDDGLQAAEGRFADLTKSADIFIDDQSYPIPTIIRDTPGVNDPFLMRESVTLANLSDSDICVIVLSAHQAFTTVDIALTRILLALEQEQIVLFINRIDELDDPDRQIDEIDASVRATLRDQGLPDDLPILFGSAIWARSTSDGLTETIIARSNATLDRLVAARLSKSTINLDPTSNRCPGSAMSNALKTSDLSGLFELQSVIEQKSAEAFGLPFVNRMRARSLEVCQQSTVLLRQALDNTDAVRRDLDADALFDQLDMMLEQLDRDCLQATKLCSEQLLFSMSEAYRCFITSETKAIEKAFKGTGNTAQWQPDTEKLRRELNVAYRAFDKTGQAEITNVFSTAAKQVSQFYEQILATDTQLFVVQEPVVTRARAPTSLMQSMTIDITTGWLEKWMTRKASKTAFLKRFNSIVTDEMRNTINDMQEIFIVDFFKTARQQLNYFLTGHISTLQQLAVLDGKDQKFEIRSKLGLESEIHKRLLLISDIEAELSGNFATEKPVK